MATQLKAFFNAAASSLAFLFLLFLSLCLCVSLSCSLHPHFLSICAGVEGRSHYSCLCYTGGGDVGAGGRWTIGQKITPGSQIWPRTERFSDTGNPLFYASLPTVLGKLKHLGLFCLFFFEVIQGKSTLDSFGFSCVSCYY